MAKKATIADKIVSYCEYPATCETIENGLGLLHQTAAALLGKLVKDGRLRIVGMTKNTRNRDVNLYQATPKRKPGRDRCTELVAQLEALVSAYKEVK